MQQIPTQLSVSKLTLAIAGTMVGVLLTAPPLYAKQLWSDNSLSLLRGNDYEVGAEGRKVLTLEHVSGHSWGDMFSFVDRLESDNGDLETYWELSPRLSIGKAMGKELTAGLIKDVLITTTAEIADGPFPFTNYLIGPAIDLDIPGFKYFQLNAYRRNNEFSDDNWQLTPVWGVPFSIAGQDFLYDGFADWRSGSGNNTTELNVTSQLTWDIGALMQTPKTLYIGVEYVYWTNKFGIQDTDERNLNALLKVHF
ncbi:MAG: ion channel protein Tsx [Pseudomonadales bacterium]|nr:ion channel protein Tsx [Pseudomonadales bacterium]